MNRTGRFIAGAALVLLLLVGGTLALTVFRQVPVTITTIHCIGGSEKSGLMADAEVQQILREKYQLAVDFFPMGSIDQALLATDDIKQRGASCLWPSSAAAQLIFEAKHTAAEFAAYKAETVLISPEVIYSGPETTDALIKAAIVEKRSDRYFIINMQKLLLDYILPGKNWEDLGTPTLRGPVLIRSTDPAKSNSGFTLYLLKLIITSTNDVFKQPTTEQAQKALPTVRQLYDQQGMQSRSSGFGFDQWILQGGEFSAPLYAGYESQIIEKVVQNPDQADRLLSNFRILYPNPTVYNEHPILALDKDAQRLIEAMKDPQIQTAAWKRYGFRAITLGITNMADFPKIPLTEQVQIAPLPRADVILMLDNCIKNNVCQ